MAALWCRLCGSACAVWCGVVPPAPENTAVGASPPSPFSYPLPFRAFFAASYDRATEPGGSGTSYVLSDIPPLLWSPPLPLTEIAMTTKLAFGVGLVVGIALGCAGGARLLCARATRTGCGSPCCRVVYVRQVGFNKTMEAPPGDMFFPVGVVAQYTDKSVEPVFDPDCRHDIQCMLTCRSSKCWSLFLWKLKQVLQPKTQGYFLSLHSMSMCDAELGRVSVNAKGKITWINKYMFL